MSTRGKRSERGASAVEYGLLVAACVAAFMFALQVLGGVLQTSYKASTPECGTAAAAGATVCSCPPSDPTCAATP